jgi:hypothetical protein
MQTQELIVIGNQHREQRQYEQALTCYAQAFAQDRRSAAAFNNYGNVLREIGEPGSAVPFLQQALTLEPNNVTAQFNLAVTHLLMGNLRQGWPAYEARWNYEHLAGTEPKFAQPRWRGEDLQGKTVLIVGEQGHGDNIQFSRFAYNLHVMGARIKLQVTAGLVPMFQGSAVVAWAGTYTDDPGEFDVWVPVMSIPGILGVTYDNLPRPVSYMSADRELTQRWQERLGPKTRMRVGFSWSGRRDSWLNQHKGMPFRVMLDLIEKNPQYEWTNLQIDATEEESAALAAAGVKLYPGTIRGFHDTAALIAHQDVILSVDTAIAHLGGALGRPTWVMLQKFGVDWRWLLDRDDSPWYSAARLFRQSAFDDWASVTNRVHQYLSWFKI